MDSNGDTTSHQWVNGTINWRSRIVRYGKIRADQIQPHPLNPRKHPIEQRKAVQASFDVLGQIAPILINENNGYLIDGEERSWLALAQGEATEVDAIWVDLTEEEHNLALTVYDWTTQMAYYDKDNLDSLLRDIDTDHEALQALLDDIATQNDITLDEDEPLEDQGPQIDKGAELAQRYGTQVGQIWQLGKHRLAIGDSTDKSVIAALMDGVIADLALTDPPYGVERDKGFGGFGGFGTPIARRTYSDDWDSERPSKEAFNLLLASCKHAIIFGGNFFADLLPQSTHWIVWDKLNTMPTFGDCELAWTNIPRKSVKKFTFEYNGLIGKEKERFHPTQKPLGLFAELLNAYSETGQIILDPFLGSGTTLIAAHQTGRIAYCCELSPEYAAVCIQRWETLTGDQATLITPTNTHEIAF